MKTDPSALRALRRFERAVGNMEMLGACHPDDHPAIKNEYTLAKAGLKKYLPLAAKAVKETE